METIEESNLIGYLTKLPFEYREKLDINQGLKFGTEIEFMSESKKGIDKVFKLMNRAHMQNNKYYRLSGSSRLVIPNFDKRIYEIKTPILENNKEDFHDLKYICDGLTNLELLPSNQKGIHVHVDLSSLEDNSRFLEDLLKVFCIYEHIIFRFSYGEEEDCNINCTAYSREISCMLYNFIRNTDFFDDFRNILPKLRELLKCKTYALNFHQKDISCKNETVEFRMFNGTLNPTILQNDINLCLNLINTITSNLLDRDLIDYKFNEYDRGFYVKESYSKLNMNDAIEFSDLIFNTNKDKDYFLRQYTIKDNPKKKKLVI